MRGTEVKWYNVRVGKEQCHGGGKPKVLRARTANGNGAEYIMNPDIPNINEDPDGILAQTACFALDMDGTIYLGERWIDGAKAFLERIEASGRNYVFVTNNSSKNAAVYVEKLERMGLSVGEDKIVTSGQATIHYLKRHFPGKKVYLLGNALLREEFLQAGIALEEDSPEVVVTAFDTSLDYHKMCKVCDFVRAGLPYLATHPDYNCPTEDGFIPDAGAIHAFINASADFDTISSTSAMQRGTSVYLVDRVIPMLPHKFSNGICSLNQGVDRLALSCLMTINEKGEVADYQVAETVIRVDCRMSYTSVRKILEDRDEAERKEYETLVPMFEQMERLAALLRKKRHKRGSIDFDFAESKILLDEKGRPVEIKPYERNVATRMVEDFMLIANETVAQHFFWLETPFVYRTHEKPDPDKIKKLATFIRNFGYHIKLTGEEIHPKELQKLLDKIADTDEETLISRLTLRSMKQAKYTVDCTGHFGLACQYYCHFTSPIRRYPDLQIHRIIKEQLRGKLSGERIKHYEEKLPEVAKHASKMERRAAEAERETDKLKKAEYMEERIGEVYGGVICGITQWGIYVELPNTVEGLIHVSALAGDYFYYDEETCEMVGKETGVAYKLGQRVTIQVKGVDRLARTVDFVFPVQPDRI